MCECVSVHMCVSVCECVCVRVSVLYCDCSNWKLFFVSHNDGKIRTQFYLHFCVALDS